jgi:ribose transport system substrate-binding protein
VVARDDRAERVDAPSESAAASGSAGASPSAAAKQYTIGYSNAFGIGNGFREEQLCTAKAQALVSGQVSSGTWTNEKEETYPQLQQIRDLISKKPDAIIFNPNGPDVLNPALAEAKAAGIKTVALDAYVTDPTR